jgi:hypothetical protein
MLARVATEPARSRAWTGDDSSVVAVVLVVRETREAEEEGREAEVTEPEVTTISGEMRVLGADVVLAVDAFRLEGADADAMARREFSKGGCCFLTGVVPGLPRRRAASSSN